MKLEFDPAADAAYVEISNTPVVVTREIEAGVIGDYDADRHLVGIEVLSVSQCGTNRAANTPHNSAAGRS
jgi:uncharacterized protein YuzE